MTGRLIALAQVDGRPAAALMQGGKLRDLRVDPPKTLPPAPETVLRAKVGRPLKGQGGAIVALPDGPGFLREAKGARAGAAILVQVLSVPEGSKAPPVTTRLLFKGRYGIITPGAPGINVARGVKSAAERARLIGIAEALDLDGAGLILRSAAEGAGADAIGSEIAALASQARHVLAQANGAPEVVLPAPDAHAIARRDWSGDGSDWLEGPEAFADAGVLEAVDAMRGAHIRLPAGASAMVEPTAALVAIDVNTGPDGSPAAGLKANLALAKELPRQLSVRGLGGQITIDFAPMAKKDRRMLEETLRRGFREGGPETLLAGWTPLGHLELQRKRDRWPLHQVWTV